MVTRDPARNHPPGSASTTSPTRVGGRVARNPAAHQQRALDRLAKWYRTPESKRGGILVLPTGGGKTFVATHFLCRGPLSDGQRILWLAHTHHLLEQANEAFGGAVSICPRMPIQRAVSASPLTDPASRFGVSSDRSGGPFWGPHRRLRRTVLGSPSTADTTPFDSPPQRWVDFPYVPQASATVQRMPARLSLEPGRLHPASTTPEEMRKPLPEESADPRPAQYPREPGAPAQPFGARRAAGPSVALVELSDEAQQLPGGGLNAGGELGDAVAERDDLGLGPSGHQGRGAGGSLSGTMASAGCSGGAGTSGVASGCMSHRNPLISSGLYSRQRPGPRPPLHLISTELVRRLARQMDTGEVAPWPYTALLPVGWYQVEYDAAVRTEEEDGGEGSPDTVEQVRNLVMVYQGRKVTFRSIPRPAGGGGLVGLREHDPRTDTRDRRPPDGLAGRGVRPQ